MKTINKIYHAAIYVRLSKEDGDVSNTAKTEISGKGISKKS